MSNQETAASANGVHHAPGRDCFAVEAGEFELDVLEAVYAFRDLAAEVKDGSQRDYVIKVQDWVRSRTGVSLTLFEADWLSDQVELLLTQKKSQRHALLVAVWPPRSANSTASTPPG